MNNGNIVVLKTLFHFCRTFQSCILLGYTHLLKQIKHRILHFSPSGKTLNCTMFFVVLGHDPKINSM